MLLHELRGTHPRKRKKPRVGRGGKRGTSSGRGTKGQKSRAGRRIRPAERDFIQRLPKLRGIKHRRIREKAEIANTEALSMIEGGRVNLKTLAASGAVKKSAFRVKILSKGDISKALTVRGVEVSKAARKKIEAAGGTVKP
jgi:large subunit ribosomal protein L15